LYCIIILFNLVTCSDIVAMSGLTSCYEKWQNIDYLCWSLSTKNFWTCQTKLSFLAIVIIL